MDVYYYMNYKSFGSAHSQVQNQSSHLSSQRKIDFKTQSCVE